MKCIKKFFYDKLPEIQKISEDWRMKELFGGKEIKNLGVEGALEACIGLFEDGRLKLVADNIKNFLIFIIEGENLLIVYEMNKGRRTV